MHKIKEVIDLIRRNGAKGIVLDEVKKDLVVTLSPDEGYPSDSDNELESIITFEFKYTEINHRVHLNRRSIVEGNFQGNGDFICKDLEGGDIRIRFALCDSKYAQPTVSLGFYVTTHLLTGEEGTPVTKELEVKRVTTVDEAINHLRKNWDLPIEEGLKPLIVYSIKTSVDHSWQTDLNSTSIGMNLVRYLHKITATIE